MLFKYWTINTAEVLLQEYLLAKPLKSECPWLAAEVPTGVILIHLTSIFEPLGRVSDF